MKRDKRIGLIAGNGSGVAITGADIFAGGLLKL